MELGIERDSKPLVRVSTPITLVAFSIQTSTRGRTNNIGETGGVRRELAIVHSCWVTGPSGPISLVYAKKFAPMCKIVIGLTNSCGLVSPRGVVCDGAHSTIFIMEWMVLCGFGVESFAVCHKKVLAAFV